MFWKVRSLARQGLFALGVYLVALCAVFGPTAWYVSHIVARIGMRLGLGMLPNIVVTFALVVGSAAVLYKLLDTYVLSRIFAAWKRTS